MIMLLPNDHTAGTTPGMPTPEAAVADNDLALGRIVEAVSRSRFWKETCIFVVQDDPQNGFDHIDGHRTVALVISPHTKRGVVESTNYNQTSMVRTMELVLGLPPMNQFDASATPLTACFTDTPDFTPYATPCRIEYRSIASTRNWPILRTRGNFTGPKSRWPSRWTRLTKRTKTL